MADSRETGALTARLLAVLSRSGPSGSAELCRTLGVSQPTFSRAMASARKDVLVAGRGRNTRYAARRGVADVPAPIPVYELRPPGEAPRRLASLHPVAPAGFFVEFAGDGTGAFHPDLPWFLFDLRPSGFLGRLVPRRHPELGLPPDVRLWSGDHVLRFLTRHGWDQPGAFVLGDEAYRTLLARVESPADAIPASERAARYPEIAADVLAFGDAGSSAAGEQPKFLATRISGDDRVPVLVKFSPPTFDGVGRRVADLLVAEHLALATLRERGIASARTSLLFAGDRQFLEVERFDRDGPAHRRGLVSLLALDAAFVGSDQSSWSASVDRLAALGLVEPAAPEQVRGLECFGGLIGNTDQHFGNLSFTLDGLRVSGLAPVYDMLPVHYAPLSGETLDTAYTLSVPGPEKAGVAAGAIDAAVTFWRAVARDERISPGFRAIAARDAERVAGLRTLVAMLPR
jgi:hypothetical protein